jgi:hypothetical protein
MTKWILGVSFAIALFLPATAAAEPFTPELETDYAAALSWWGVESPPQCATVTFEQLWTAPPGSEILGFATTPEPGQADLACELIIYAGEVQPGCQRENIVRHEVGHLTGRHHSDDPQNIMYPTTNWPYWCPESVPTPSPASEAALEAEVAEEVAAAHRREWAAIRARRAQCPLRAHPRVCSARLRSWAREIREAG